MMKRFTDSIWGGKAKALVAAKQYRDEILRTIPPLTKQEYANLKRKNNVTGVAGVSRKERASDFFWLARLQLPNGKTLSASFPESRHGAEEAKALAIRARQDMLKQLDGEQYFVPMHGDVLKRLSAAPSKGSRVDRPRTLTARIAHYISDKGMDQINVRVSNGIEKKQRCFNVGFHGDEMAWLLAARTAQSLVEHFGGVEARRRFVRDVTARHEALPSGGISFRMALTTSAGSPKQSQEKAELPKSTNKSNLLNERKLSLRTLYVRIVKYQRKHKKATRMAVECLHLQVSDGVRKFRQSFSLNFHGEEMALAYSKRAALKAAREIGGLGAAAIFEEKYLRQWSVLPENGIQARIPIIDA